MLLGKDESYRGNTADHWQPWTRWWESHDIKSTASTPRLFRISRDLLDYTLITTYGSQHRTFRSQPLQQLFKNWRIGKRSEEVLRPLPFSISLQINNGITRLSYPLPGNISRKTISRSLEKVFIVSEHVVLVPRSCAARPRWFAAFTVLCWTPVLLAYRRPTNLPVLWPMSILAVSFTILTSMSDYVDCGR